MISGCRILSLIRQWWIPPSCKLFLLRSRGKEYQLSIVALPSLLVHGGSFRCFQRNLHSATGEVVDSGSAFVYNIGSKGLKKLEEVFKVEKYAVDKLLYVAKILRAMPVVDLQIPTLCLVGAPNVGKSSLVRILSTGKPEVCNYPFTTRGILMGHIVLNFERFQVTDTPGLLRRHDDDRNNLEKLTLAVLEHLPTAILYVHDLTGECGISPADQFIIYKDIKGRFGDHLWLDVVSKSDLMQAPMDGILKDDDGGDDDDDNDDYVDRYKKFGPDDAIWVSVKTEAGISELKSRVEDLLTSQMGRIRSGNCNHAECES